MCLTLQSSILSRLFLDNKVMRDCGVLCQSLCSVFLRLQIRILGAPYQIALSGREKRKEKKEERPAIKNPRFVNKAKDHEKKQLTGR